MALKTQALGAYIATIITLALAVTNASANQLSISNQNIRSTWTSLRSITSTNATILCPVTVEGSFHGRTIAKTIGALVGYITRASVANSSCTGGRFTVHNESLPWHLTYEGFGGTLPSIERITVSLLGASYEIEDSTNICTGTTEVEFPWRNIIRLNTTTHVAETLTPGTNSIPLRNGRGGLFCGIANDRFGGESQTLTQLGTSTSISITLIGPVRLEPSPVSFGTVEPNSLLVRTVTIATEGETTINSIRMASANYFAITDPNRCTGKRLAAAERCSFKVVFVAPGEAGREPRDTVTVETTTETVSAEVSGRT